MIFSARPEADVDRVLEFLIGNPNHGVTRSSVSKAIDAALASKVDLARLLPQRHSDATLRRYLGKVKEKLAQP